jgi:ankyrin repeat protein
LKEIALRLAAGGGHLDIVNWLVARQANINANGEALLQVPSRFNTLIFLALTSDELESTALHLAAQNGNLDTVKFLARHGADIDAEGERLPTFPSLISNIFSRQTEGNCISFGSTWRALGYY